MPRRLQSGMDRPRVLLAEDYAGVAEQLRGLRVYGPEAPAFDGTWKRNDIEKVK